MEKQGNSKKIFIKDYQIAEASQNFKTPVKLDVDQLQTSLNHELSSEKQVERDKENNKIKKNISLNIKIEPCTYKSESIIDEQQQSVSGLKNITKSKCKPRFRTKNKIGEHKQSKNNQKQIRFLINQDKQKEQGEEKKSKKGLNDQSRIKDMFDNYRLNKLKYHFFSQLRKNSLFRTPVHFQPFDSNNRYVSNKQQFEGIQISRILLNFAYFVSISHTILACFFTTLLLVFRELSYNEFIKYFQILTIVILGCEIFMGFIRIRSFEQKNLVKIRQICRSYLYYSFWIDLLCFLCGFISYLFKEPYLNYCFIAFFLKLPDCIQKLDKIETKIFDSFYWEQYWGLMKVLSTNFVYAHFIAILLLMMSWLDEDQSWMTVKNILDSPWYEQYSWAYYWGTNIMLTVGFGDISAANYKQAICLVLIQTLSCMTLAYNINEIGGLIKNLRSKQVQKQKSLKVLKKLCYKNQINSDLSLKLTTHVNQIYKIQTKYNFQEEEQFIQKLPINIKQEFYRTTNFKILQKLTFIKNFTHRTLLELAQKLQVRIYRPDQILYENVGFIDKIVILKQGQVGIFASIYSSKSQIINAQRTTSAYKNTNNKHNKTIIDKYTIKQGQDACLISLDFLSHAHNYSHNNVKNYEIRSTGYSKMFQISIEDLLKILKKKDVDIQYYCALKDEEKCNMDQFQLIKCEHCNENEKYNNKNTNNNQLIKESKDQNISNVIYHTKFKCPKLHYCPISQQIIYKHLHKVKVQKNKRKQFDRKKTLTNSLLKYKQANDEFKSNEVIIMSNYLLEQLNTNNSLCECQQCKYKLQDMVIGDLKDKSSHNLPSQDNSLNSTANFSSEHFLMRKEKRTLINIANNLNILRKRKQTSQYSNSASQLKTKLLKNATEIMEKQMELLLKQNYQRQHQFWKLEVDQAKDYKFYFPKCNPKVLQSIRFKKNQTNSNICAYVNTSCNKSLNFLSKSMHKKPLS